MGTLDSIVARIESYLGEFLQTRQKLLDARKTLESAYSVAQSSGYATIGRSRYTAEQLSSLLEENKRLLDENADLSTRIPEFISQAKSILSGVEGAVNQFVPEEEYFYETPGILGGGIGALPAAAPAIALIATGAALATSLWMFMSSAKRHLAQVAGDVGGNLLLYGGLALLIYFWVTRKQR